MEKRLAERPIALLFFLRPKLFKVGCDDMSSKQIWIVIVLVVIVAAALALYYGMQPAEISDRISATHAKAYDDLAAVETIADKAVRELVARAISRKGPPNPKRR